MAHIGIICVPATGHLNTMTPLGCELKKRGHQVTLIGLLDAKAKTEAAGLTFRAYAEKTCPLGFTPKSLVQLGELSGINALRYAINLYQQDIAVMMQECLEVVQGSKVNFLLIDQASFGASSIAELLGIPFITVTSTLMLNREESIPPFNFGWNYSLSPWARLRNKLGYKLLNILVKPLAETINGYRQSWNLPLFTDYNDTNSQIAQICRQPVEFEFPRQELPNYFHFTGSFHSPTSRAHVDFPYDKLNGKPLIYASMGTIQNRLLGVFSQIAEACQDLDVQLVISLGDSADPATLPSFKAEPIIVKYAPQLELLQKAKLTITHAGLNTTLESLSYGVPMVAIPIANDQPGTAARIAWTGTGVVIPVKKLTVPKLRNAIQTVLSESKYRDNAKKMQAAMQKSGGVKMAADIVEEAIATGKPVLRK
ncbi:MAG: glycosyl transferase family 1 [Pseudanabaena frigida]|uniref:Glycosyl transferase family 1 n=1 Tax=Pseudanabaena frigida TaxID=945775 RepID=A0A2W4W614_9CYAN|nr:MAG: glycosyl transferase family 1 [Pseudanabaena frigida]